MDNYEITFNTWNKLAQVYQDKFMDLDLYNDSYDLFCSLVKSNPSILEIGCGPGNITRYLLSKRPDFEITAIDVAPTMIALAKRNLPEANFLVMDCRDLSSLPCQFDAVICGFCLPYVSKQDTLKLLLDSRNLLNENGVIYLSCIENDYQKSGLQSGSTGDQTFVYYYQMADLELMLTENNFEIMHEMRLPYERSNGSLEFHLIVIARQKLQI